MIYISFPLKSLQLKNPPLNFGTQDLSDNSSDQKDIVKPYEHPSFLFHFANNNVQRSTRMAGNEERTGQVPPIVLMRPANTTTTSHATSRQACSLADKVVALHNFMDFVDHRFSCPLCNCRCLFYIFFCLGCNEC